MMWHHMLNIFKSKSLADRLNKTKLVRIYGIKFRIRKLNALDYMDGSRAMIQSYDEYQIGKSKNPDTDIKKIKRHFTDVIMAGVVSPKLSRKKDDEGLYVENLFTDFDLANELYTSIMLFTYGKKKD